MFLWVLGFFCIVSVKVKVKVTLEQATKAQRGYSYDSTLSLTLAALPRERPNVHCIGGWVGRRASLGGCGKSLPRHDSIPGPSSP